MAEGSGIITPDQAADSPFVTTKSKAGGTGSFGRTALLFIFLTLVEIQRAKRRLLEEAGFVSLDLQGFYSVTSSYSGVPGYHLYAAQEQGMAAKAISNLLSLEP